MTISISSPYLATAPTTARAVGDVQNHILYSLEEELVLIPILITTTTGGALASFQVTHRCWVEDLTGGALRIHHPSADPNGTYLFLSRNAAVSYTTDRSTASSGYTDIDVGANVVTLEGVLALRGIGGKPSLEEAFEKGSDLASRQRTRVKSVVQWLTVGFYRFQVDGSGDPITTTYRGTNPFHVNHTGAGTYTISTNSAYPDGVGMFVEAEGTTGSAVQGSGGNELDLTLAADPANTKEIRICVFSPVNAPANTYMKRGNTLAPTVRSARASSFFASGLGRDLCVIPFSFAVDGSGLVNYASTNTVLPANVAVTKVSNDYEVAFGRCLEQFCFASATVNSTAGTVDTDYSEVASDGKVTFTTGAITSTVVSGFILASTTREI